VEEKDNIKELFQDRFQDFEAQVDPGVWNNIQSELASSPSIPSNAATGSIGKTIMWVAAVSIATVSAISFAVFNDSEGDLASQETIPVEETIQSSINKETNVTVEPNDEVVNEGQSVISDEVVENLNKPSKVAEEPTNDKISKDNTGDKVLSEKVIEPKIELDEPIIDPNEEDIVQEKVSPQINENVTTNIVSKAPNSINIESQSRVVASPMGGNAPLEVNFNSISSVKNIKWIFDDGAESTDLTPAHVYEKPGVYFVTMMAELESGEVVMDKAVIEVKESSIKKNKVVEESSIFVPNIFTPNGDSENDKLNVVVKNVNTFTISIYCVNGRLVYSSDNPEDQWDGTDMRGEEVEDGVYYYLINAIGENENVYAPKGYVTVKRSY